MGADVMAWRADLEAWLAPFLVRLSHPARRKMCPLYVAGLIGPGERKSVQPIAERLGLPSHDALHHFIAAGTWDAGPLEAELAAGVDRLAGGPDARLVIDDTALPKKGSRSVGVAPQYASTLGKNANCQTPSQASWPASLRERMIGAADHGLADADRTRGTGPDRPAAIPAGELGE